MNQARATQLSYVPRTLGPEIQAMVWVEHPVGEIALFGIIGGVLITVILAALSLFGVLSSWTLPIVGLGFTLLCVVVNAIVTPAGKRRCRETLANAPLVCVGIVQGHQALYEPGRAGSFPAVLVYAEDPQHFGNFALVTSVVQQLRNLVQAPGHVPGAQLVQSRLLNENSFFNEMLPPELTYNVPMRWRVTTVDSSKFTDKRIPADGLALFFRLPHNTVQLAPPVLWQ